MQKMPEAQIAIKHLYTECYVHLQAKHKFTCRGRLVFVIVCLPFNNVLCVYQPHPAWLCQAGIPFFKLPSTCYLNKGDCHTYLHSNNNVSNTVCTVYT